MAIKASRWRILIFVMARTVNASETVNIIANAVFAPGVGGLLAVWVLNPGKYSVERSAERKSRSMLGAGYFQRDGRHQDHLAPLPLILARGD